ncbi:LON peptidase substrate-binding domain-containing protein [Aeoliella mucimassa]|uniref:Lon protease 2 n=1 Tax=Aeoliella mucimassa TaxID=2527972 RepID=A0A518AQV0_9BACT|nr:LON peptidase substrate-binding domain-containing protein [Aeoliella mucimassa]QDU57098.1 Lon protease 2 [Aeoliella mucimassa]
MNPSDLQHVEFNPDDFSGRVRLFPIPNLVMFPHVVQPLHIFEERYREMMQDALATDQLIAMPVLQPGWEPEYAGRPPIEPWACLGKVVLHNKLPDGCYNLLLMGVARLRLEEELPAVRSFREARAELMEEFLPKAEGECCKLRKQLTSIFDGCVRRGEAPHAVRQLLATELPLTTLTDLMAYALPLSSEVKLNLLAQPCAKQRAEILLELLDDRVASAPSSQSTGDFPPPFSTN